MSTQDYNEEACEIIQASLSDSIDSNRPFSEDEKSHIEQCSECRAFSEMWQNDSILTQIASGAPAQSNNISEPVISLITENAHNSSPIKPWLKITAIAASITFMSILTFVVMNKQTNTTTPLASLTNNENSTPNTTSQINISLTEEKLEQALEKNYSELSEAALETWKSTTTSISKATDYLTEGPQYLSMKFLSPSKDQTMHNPIQQSLIDQLTS